MSSIGRANITKNIEKGNATGALPHPDWMFNYVEGEKFCTSLENLFVNPEARFSLLSR